MKTVLIRDIFGDWIELPASLIIATDIINYDYVCLELITGQRYFISQREYYRIQNQIDKVLKK